MRDEYVANPPDLVYSYSNVGISLLGLGVQSTVGEDFAAFAGRSLLTPLGMTHSSFAPVLSGEGAARAYGKGGPKLEPALGDVPAGGLNSNVIDLAQFVRMVFAEGRHDRTRILRPESVAEMLRRQNAAVALDGDLETGLGWFFDGLAGRPSERIAMHDGATIYHRSAFAILPGRRLGAIVLANTASAEGFVHQIAREALEIALRTKEGIAPAPTSGGGAIAKRPLTKEERRSYAGEYDSEYLGFVRVEPRGERLRARWGDGAIDLSGAEGGGLTPEIRLLGLMALPVPIDARLSLESVAGREVPYLLRGKQRLLAAVKSSPRRYRLPGATVSVSMSRSMWPAMRFQSGRFGCAWTASSWLPMYRCGACPSGRVLMGISPSTRSRTKRLSFEAWTAAAATRSGSARARTASDCSIPGKSSGASRTEAVPGGRALPPACRHRPMRPGSAGMNVAPSSTDTARSSASSRMPTTRRRIRRARCGARRIEQATS
jgi:hypothetical protein